MSATLNALPQISWRHWVLLFCIFLVALSSRLYSAQTVGWHWDKPDSFTLINFDEAASCRHYISGRGLERHVGWTTVNVATLLGHGPSEQLYDKPSGWSLESDARTKAQKQEVRASSSRVKAYCHSAEHMRIARSYSAVLGGLTVLVLGLLGMLLVPENRRIGLTAAALLAVSGFHASQSHMASLDAPSVFFVYAMITWAVFCLRIKAKIAWALLPPLLYLAIDTKEWPFALLSLLAFLPVATWHFLIHGFTVKRFLLAAISAIVFLSGITNTDPAITPYFLAALTVYCFAIPWREIHRSMLVLWLILPLLFLVLFQGGYMDVILTTHFTGPLVFHQHGTGWSAIGWHKVLRNLLNVPLSLVMGLGVIAVFCLFPGMRALLTRTQDTRVWLVFLSVLVFAIFLAFFMTTPYYRHYLMLIPVAALIASMGFWSLKISKRRWALPVFLAWPALLGLDMVSDYHLDPRREMREWYFDAKPQRVFMSYFVNPPPEYASVHRIFIPDYALGKATTLRGAQYLVLNENWYDTAFRNEMNGPLASDLTKLLGTKPEYARFYRQALAGENPYLTIEKQYTVQNFMPEMVLHKWLYGTFQMFVGDVIIFKIGAKKTHASQT